MAYDHEAWLQRHARRSDLATRVTHLTRAVNDGTTEVSAIEVLIKILKEETLLGSSTSSGFIVGKRKAVCFQDAPLTSVAQNIHFEHDIRVSTGATKIRYNAAGLMFTKAYVYRKGGRPVLYEQTAIAKQLLPEEEWWRIVNFDLTNNAAFVDWTHEREWRVPDDFTFKRKEAIVIISAKTEYRTFLAAVGQVKQETGLDILGEIAGIVHLQAAYV